MGKFFLQLLTTEAKSESVDEWIVDNINFHSFVKYFL